LVLKRRAGELLKELARAEHNRNPEGAGGKSGKAGTSTDATCQPSPYAEALATAWVSRKTANRSI
jgi:hypothetical protein